MDHAYAWLSQWAVNYTATVGQYQNCNGYGSDSACLGDNAHLLGREAGLGLGSPLAGQCDANNDTGTWWSLPAAGKCSPGTQPSPGTCAWTASRVKTINGTCLFDTHAFNRTCAQDGRAPFSRARQVFERAFASDDVAKGGCPPIA